MVVRFDYSWLRYPGQRPPVVMQPDDASRARMVADNFAHALDVTIGAVKATAEGRNPFVVLALVVVEQVNEAHGHATGQPAPHCRHGQHFARHVHAARAR